jgi:hypothetical protein
MRATTNARGSNPSGGERKAAPKPTFRSRVTAGLTLLPSIDGRSTWARVMRDTYHAMLAHAGGADHVPETKRLLARRIACLESELINLETRFAAYHAEGREVAEKYLDLYGRLVGSQRRCLEALGWERTARDLTPTLDAYLATKHQQAEEAEYEEAEA